MNMTRKIVTMTLVFTISTILISCKDGATLYQGQVNNFNPGWNFSSAGTGPFIQVAAQVESAADKLFSFPTTKLNRITKDNQSDIQSCETDDTAIVTIYSTNGRAQSEIEVEVDGNIVGNLTTYFPDGGPNCKTPSKDGIITLMVPAGDHTLEANSPNYYWPTHNFSTEKCKCILLPLS